MRPWSNFVVPLFLAAALFLPAGCGSLMGARLEADADLAFRMGHYARAHAMYLELLERWPRNADLQRKERIARVATWLALGREAYFLERLADSEGYFRKVLGEVPGHAEARGWLTKVQHKQAEVLVTEAIGQSVRQEFDQARRLVHQALALRADHPVAARLLEEFEARLDRERALGRLLLAEGLKILQESVEQTHLPVIRHYLLGAQALMGEEFTHDWVLEEVDRRLGVWHLAQVKDALERDENASAFIQAAQASSFLREFSDLEELRSLAQRELEADALAEEARQLILRGETRKGGEKLAMAARTSVGRGGFFKAAQVEVEEARLARAYEQALDLEARGLFEEALAAFQEIAQENPYFRDAEARARDLEAAIEQADRILGEVRLLVADGEDAQALRRLKDLFMLFPWHREGLLLQRRLNESRARGADGKNPKEDDGRP